jgi:hypothetical protein
MYSVRKLGTACTDCTPDHHLHGPLAVPLGSLVVVRKSDRYCRGLIHQGLDVIGEGFFNEARSTLDRRRLHEVLDD